MDGNDALGRPPVPIIETHFPHRYRYYNLPKCVLANKKPRLTDLCGFCDRSLPIPRFRRCHSCPRISNRLKIYIPPRKRSNSNDGKFEDEFQTLEIHLRNRAHHTYQKNHSTQQKTQLFKNSETQVFSPDPVTVETQTV